MTALASKNKATSSIPTVNDAGLFYSTASVAYAIGVQEPTVRKWCREGRIRAVRIGKAWRIPVSALQDLAEDVE